MDEPEPTGTQPREPDRGTAAAVERRVADARARRRRGGIELVIGTMFCLVGPVMSVAAGRAAYSLIGILVMSCSLLAGIALVITGIVRQYANRAGRVALDAEHAASVRDVDGDALFGERRRRVRRGWIEVSLGLVGVVGGLALVFRFSGPRLEHYLLGWLPYIVGYITIVMGVLRLLNADQGLVKPANASGARNDLQFGVGFKTFVAWRYLMARHHRVSRIVLAVFFVALFATVASVVLGQTVFRRENPLGLDPELLQILVRVALIAMIAGCALVYFSVLIGLLRFVYTFFTTVPIVGVWIGTAALIIVLSVMSGFETDLRKKILGSNAHIQVTAESGDIQNWREVKARIDKVPGVLASTPYAVSEVVIAANNNGMNVIIKGIDPATVGSVTNLVDVIKDDRNDAMKRLEPLVTDETDLVVPPSSDSGKKGPVIDPPPADMPDPGEPIDFSEPRGRDDDAGDAGDIGSIYTDETPSLDDPEPPRPGTVRAGDAGMFGGDAEYLVETKPLIDPPPPDFVGSDDEPADLSGSDETDLPIEVVDVPFDQTSLSKRTQSLPGILVGQELVKQTHLYVGEEVRIVSPLSDPANPDANGTPIPFNRDYRVAGIFYTGMYEYDLKYVYVTLDSLQDFLDRGDVVDGIEIRIGSPDDTDEYVARLHQTLGEGYRVQDWKELNRSLFSALKLEKIAMFLVLGIVILVASFSIVGNLIMVVVEKNREIALIKTLGASDSTVMFVFAIQGLVIGLIGTGLGVGTGRLACWLLERFGFPLNPDVYYIDQLPVDVNGSSIALTALAGVVISMLATFYPAVVAARVRPAAGMRH